MEKLEFHKTKEASKEIELEDAFFAIKKAKMQIICIDITKIVCECLANGAAVLEKNGVFVKAKINHDLFRVEIDTIIHPNAFDKWPFTEVVTIRDYDVFIESDFFKEAVRLTINENVIFGDLHNLLNSHL